MTSAPGDEQVELGGVLRRDGGGFVLHADDGGRYPLELGRTPVDLVAKRARLVGRRGADGRIAVDAIAPG